MFVNVLPTFDTREFSALNEEKPGVSIVFSKHFCNGLEIAKVFIALDFPC